MYSLCCVAPMLILLRRWAFPIVAVLWFLAIYWRCLGGRKGIARSLLPLYNGSYRSSNRPRTDWSIKYTQATRACTYLILHLFGWAWFYQCSQQTDNRFIQVHMSMQKWASLRHHVSFCCKYVIQTINHLCSEVSYAHSGQLVSSNSNMRCWDMKYGLSLFCTF